MQFKINKDIENKLLDVRKNYNTCPNSLKEVKEVYYKTAWAKEVPADPILVIAIRKFLIEKERPDNFHMQKAFTSDFYGQIKHWLKKCRIIEAINFWIISYLCSRDAKKELTNGYVINPEELCDDVLDAPYFIFAKIPLIGRWINKEPLSRMKESVTVLRDSLHPQEHVVMIALLEAKIFSLTGDIRHKESVKFAGIKRGDNVNQLERIAKLIGLNGDVERLFKFCNI